MFYTLVLVLHLLSIDATVFGAGSDCSIVLNEAAPPRIEQAVAQFNSLSDGARLADCTK